MTAHALKVIGSGHDGPFGDGPAATRIVEILAAWKPRLIKPAVAV